MNAHDQRAFARLIDGEEYLAKLAAIHGYRVGDAVVIKATLAGPDTDLPGRVSCVNGAWIGVHDAEGMHLGVFQRHQLKAAPCAS